MNIRKLKKVIFDRKKCESITKDFSTLMAIPHQKHPTLKRLVNNLVSELSKKEKELENLSSEVSNIYEEIVLLYRVSEDIISLVNLNEILYTIISYALSQVNASQGIIILSNKEKNEFEIKASLGFENLVVKGKKINYEDTVFKRVIASGKTYIENNLEHNSSVIRDFSFKNILVSPLRTKTINIGYLCLFNKPIDYDSLDSKIITILTNQTSISIEKAFLYADLQHLFLESVEALSSAIDAKDHYTHGHSYRVAQFALLLANKIGLPLEKKKSIHLAGLLHDIGKIKTPMEILHKPDVLTKDEFVEIKKHPQVSTDIIKHIKKLETALPGVLYHHEHYSGEGYPSKLKGENIPLEARILCIVDSFDAMISERSYRSKMTVKQALQELYNYSGTQFDPKLVEVFSSLSKAINKMLKNHKIKNTSKKIS
ncbi:MAG: HD domain-containing protein [bacterium]|nr:HD domain-containing protein [bacterium]